MQKNCEIQRSIYRKPSPLSPGELTQAHRYYFLFPKDGRRDKCVMSTPTTRSAADDILSEEQPQLS